MNIIKLTLKQVNDILLWRDKNKDLIRHNKISENRQWHIDCWNVAGHIRHLANGKEIYIKPYTKGKGRLNNKIYII